MPVHLTGNAGVTYPVDDHDQSGAAPGRAAPVPATPARFYGAGEMAGLLPGQDRQARPLSPTTRKVHDALYGKWSNQSIRETCNRVRKVEAQMDLMLHDKHNSIFGRSTFPTDPRDYDEDSFQAHRAGAEPTAAREQQGIPLARRRSLENLINATVETAQRSKIGKFSSTTIRKFKNGVEALNERSEKEQIDEQAAQDYYRQTAETQKSLPSDLKEKGRAYREALAKRTMGPNATVAEYSRNKKDALAKKTIGPDATFSDYTREKKHALAKKTMGADATTADYQRMKTEALAKKTIGPNATAADYSRNKKDALAKKTMGPDATATDYERMRREALAKKTIGPGATAADYERMRREALAKKTIGPGATAADYQRMRREAHMERAEGPDGDRGD